MAIQKDYVFRLFDEMNKWSQLGNMIWIERGVPLYQHLKSMGDDILEPLIETLDHPNPLKRGWAADLIGEMHLHNGEDALLQRLELESNHIVKYKLQTALRHLEQD